MGYEAFDVERLKASGAVGSSDVLAIRRALFGDGTISAVEAETIFEINRACREQDVDWAHFFVEALTDFVVHQAVPQGYVSAENAVWLIERITADGVVDSLTELELLVKVIEEARFVPTRLAQFALEQVKIAVIEGKGPLRNGSALEPGVINAAEVDLLRRILYAFGGDGALAITRAEAEVLFDINDATAEFRNDPSWSSLFVKAIANHLMAASGYTAPSREEALRQEQWLEERPGAAGFLTSMLAGLGSVFDVYTEKSWEEDALERIEQRRLAMLVSEEITGPEAEWLVERIGRDGKLRDSERALLAFLKGQGVAIHPSLSPLLSRAT